MLQTCAVLWMNRHIRYQYSPLGHYLKRVVTLCVSGACKRPPCTANSGFYFTATSIMHNLSTSSHTMPVEFTHLDYHLGKDPSQKSVVNLCHPHDVFLAFYLCGFYCTQERSRIIFIRGRGTRCVANRERKLKKKKNNRSWAAVMYTTKYQ